MPPLKSTRRSRIHRWWLRLGVCGGLICLSGCALQRRLIYFPKKLPAVTAEAIAAREGFVLWRNSDGEINGWKMPAKGRATGSVLILHGNAGCALDRGYLAGPIRDAGPVDVYVLEYPGYGARAGSPSRVSVLAAAEEGFAAIPGDAPIYIVSESLGAGPAAYLARLHPTAIAGMAMLVPYDDLARVAQRKFPFLPVYFLLVDRFRPAAWLKDYRGPIKFVLAERDEVIPRKSGRRLFDKFQGPKLLQIIPGARHNDVAEQSSEWWSEVISFWRQNSPRQFPN
jgi:uncharacterized protein